VKSALAAMQTDEDPLPADIPLKVLLADLRNDAVAYAQAKADLIRIEAAEKAKILGIMVGLIAMAAVLAFAALAAALFGVTQLLAPLIGLGWAIVSVTMSAILLAIGIGWFAIDRVRGVFARKPSA
jgi:hypothetical protein